jgi:hypothetical protein
LEVLLAASLFEKRALRDVEASFGLAKSTLADALAKRSCAFFQDLVAVMVGELIQLTSRRSERQELRDLLAVDATTCLLNAGLGKRFLPLRNKATAALKLHVVWNVNEEWIEDFLISGYRRNDGSVFKQMPIARGKTYVYDRAYIDVGLWLKITESGSHFVTRLKKIGKRLAYVHRAHTQDNDQLGVLHDGTWTPSHPAMYRQKINTKKKPQFRHIIYRDPGTKRLFDFITSDFEAPAQAIADIYRQRWQVELLFRWLKQHLNIRRLALKNLNGLKTQLHIAVLAQLLLRALKIKNDIKSSAWQILRSLRASIDVLAAQRLMQQENPVAYSLQTLRSNGLGDRDVLKEPDVSG